MRRNVTILMALILVGCAANVAEKPLITVSVFQRIVSTCGGAKPDVHRIRNNPLPFVSAQLPAAEGEDGKPTPVFDCVTARLTRYRYDMFGFTYAAAEK